MTKEIEKKFLIRENNNEYYREEFTKKFGNLEKLKEKVLKEGIKISQGYIVTNKNGELRLSNRGESFYLTFKSDGLIVREEFENVISKEKFLYLWSLTKGKRVEKLRLKIPLNNYFGEIDFYLDRDLIVLEIEVKSKKDYLNLPLFGLDVTENINYKNKNLAK